MKTLTHIDRVQILELMVVVLIAPVQIRPSLVKAIFPPTAMFLILPKGCLSRRWLPMMIPDGCTVFLPTPRLLLLLPLVILPCMLRTLPGR